jgi:hypothetical protein
VRTFLADEFASTRRLLVELHLAGQRHPDVAALLAAWHTAQAPDWGSDGEATAKTFFLLLLGLCQLEALSSLPGSPADVTALAERLVAVLFPEEGSP